MQRIHLILLFLLTAGACRNETDSPSSLPEKFAQAGVQASVPAASDSVVSNGQVCKFRIDEPSINLAVFTATARLGGRTCYASGQGWAYIPEEASGCTDLSRINLSLTGTMSMHSAEKEFLSCTAVNSNPSATSKHAVTFSSPSSLIGDENTSYRAFIGDTQALVTNDALEVTYYGSKFGIICMETENPQRVLRHIAEAGIPLPSDVNSSVHEGSCAPIFSAQNQRLIGE